MISNSNLHFENNSQAYSTDPVLPGYQFRFGSDESILLKEKTWRLYKKC